MKNIQYAFFYFFLPWIILYTIFQLISLLINSNSIRIVISYAVFSAFIPALFFFLIGILIFNLRKQVNNVNLFKNIIGIILLTGIDQIIKYFILFFSLPIYKITGVADKQEFAEKLSEASQCFYLSIVHNTVKPNVSILVFLGLLFICCIIYHILQFGKYELYFYESFFIFFIAGVLCSYMDSVVHKGSYDYIGIYNFGTIDLKDIYIFIAVYTGLYMLSSFNKNSEKEVLALILRYIKR